MVYYVMLIILITPSLTNGHCIDIHSHIVNQGLHYVPGPNSCTVCICDKGSPKWCKSVLCSPPQDCQSFEVGNSCCEFKCLDDILNKSENYSDTYDMALRLIASLVTAVLSLSLLFFLIHRFRQRKIRLSQNSQLNDDHHSFNGIGYITGSLGYLSGSMGYLSSANNDIEYHYSDGNYPFWKPSGNYFPRGEAPPPYEEAVRAARTEASLLNMSTNLTPFSFTTNGSENVSLTLVHNTHVNITPNVPSQSLERQHQSTDQAQQYNMLLHSEQHSEPITLEDHQVNNSSTNVRLVCRQSANKNCTVNSSSTLVQNAMLVNQVDVHSDNGMSLPIVMLASNKTSTSTKIDSDPQQQQHSQQQLQHHVQHSQAHSQQQQPHSQYHSQQQHHPSHQQHKKGHFSMSKSDHQVNNISQQTHVDKQIQKCNPNVNNTSGCSKSSNCDNNTRTLNKKFKYSNNVTAKDVTRKPKQGNSKVYQKGCEPTKTSPLETSSNSNQKQSVVLNQTPSASSYMNGTKHRTIPQIYSTSMNMPTDPEMWAAEEIVDRRNQTKDSLLASYKTYSHSSNHDNSHSRRNDVSMHCTLPKSLRDLNNAFNLNFNYTNKDEESNDSEVRDLSLPTTTLLLKGNKDDNNCEIYYTNIEALKSKLYPQPEKRNQGKNKSYSSHKYLNSRGEKSKSMIIQEVKSEEALSTTPISNLFAIATTNNEASNSIETSGTEATCQENSVNPYYCSSPIQDLDDYRSECENCKSLSFENCSEEMDVLNETMTLQRHPVEQDENQMYYRTSLTLPSHTKKVRSVMLNTSRESWFMAMQEITSSSDSD